MSRLPALLATALCLAACASPDPLPERQVVLNAGETLAAARGVWLSEESGWILEIDGDGITRWQDTPAGCYRTTQDGPTLMSQVEYRYFTAMNDQSARFEYLPGDGHAVFARQPALPDECGTEDLTSPTAVFETFTGIFARHYAAFERRGVDWEAEVAAARPRVSDAMDDAALFAVLSDLIEPLGDSHTKLIADFDGARHRAQFGLGETLPMIADGMGEMPWLIGLIDQTMTDLLDPGARHIGNDRVIVGTIDQRIGYIQIFTMGGFIDTETPGTPEWAAAELAALDAMLDEALTEFADLDAVILDLSNNRGGYDAVTRAIASRFTDAGFDGYSVRTDPDGPPLIAYRIEPHDGPRYTGPTHVLTSDVTVSAGEITTMMLRQRPHVTQVGTTTRGAFSTPLAKPLPNGWYLELANEIFADGNGEIYEARGLEPEIRLDVFPADDPVAGHAAAVRALVARIPEE
ncbi:S41 family peptidase [Maricaulis sp.]|uniref:S41 family peptidase n=1 Tax=Maricaulis sp. TaxID=1486257 RepID=UPI0025C1299A|nr:S41 family peptidase [Maricaulis sp.]